jgi:hypothetical protein
MGRRWPATTTGCRASIAFATGGMTATCSSTLRPDRTEWRRPAAVAAVHGRASNSSKWTQHSAKRCGKPTLSLSGTRSPSSACGARRRQAHHPQGAVAARRVGPLARHAAALARTNALPAGTALRTTPLRTDRVLLADCDHVPCRDHAAIQVSDQLARHAPPYPDQFGRVRG